MLGAIAALVIDRNFAKAAGFALASSAMTFFGFMHGEAVGINQSPLVALAYLGVGALLYGSAYANRNTVVAPAIEPVHKHEAAVSAS